MRIEARDRRAILIGVAAAAAIALYPALIRPLWRVATDLEQRSALAGEFLSRYRDVIAAGATYAVAADTADARLARLLPETFPGDAQGSVNRLLEMLERAATESNVRVTRTNPIPVDSAGPGLLQIGARLECESDLAGLLGFLRALETAGKLLHVSGLRISTVGGAAAEDEIQVLRSSFTVVAFVLALPDGDENAEAAAR